MSSITKQYTKILTTASETCSVDQHQVLILNRLSLKSAELRCESHFLFLDSLMCMEVLKELFPKKFPAIIKHN